MLPTDIYVLCPDGRKVHSHLTVLRAASTRLEAVLKGFQGDHLPVQGVDSTALELIINSFYSGTCPVTTHSLPAIYDAASKLEAKSLAEECQNFLFMGHLNADNCCTLLHGCFLYKTKALSQPCHDLALSKFTEVISSASYLSSRLEIIVELLLLASEKNIEPHLIAFAAAAWLEHDTSRMEFEKHLQKALSLPPNAIAHCRRANSQGFPSRPPVTEPEVILKVESWGHLVDPNATVMRMGNSGTAQEELSSISIPSPNTLAGADNAPDLQTSLLALLNAGGAAPSVLQQLQMQVVNAAAAAAAQPANAVDDVSVKLEDGSQEGAHGKRKREDEEAQLEGGQQLDHDLLQQHHQQDVDASGSNISPADLIAVLSGSVAGGSDGQANLMALILQQQQQRPLEGGSLLMQQMAGAAGSANSMDALKQLLNLSMDQQQQAAAYSSAAAAAASTAVGASGLSDEALALQQLLAASGLSAMSGLSAGSPNSNSMLMNSLKRLQQDPGQLAALSALTMGGGGQDTLSMNMTNLFSGGAHQLLGLQGAANQGLLQQYGLLQQPSGGPGQYGDDERRGKGSRQPRQTPLGAKGLCHVENCNADLTGLREYHLRYKICEYHLKAPSILKDGQNQRFCQQCGRFHTLDAFDGNRRSCRTMLQRHNARRAKKTPADTPTGTPGGSGVGGAANTTAAQAASLATLNALASTGMGEEFLRSMLQPMM
ncbi:hypothetical protein CEUSTIGMA_g2351.t1 [Chlamydomonas eustigma]|uniref:SBP-type domain-containing protein n=1 Tax=Chlamydomonas eustigma TaxID=1157962 RepID=A0A250WVT5_9CHLO|nr:hypothetical protein CEUSTIGMA_g2351.t1 [Chlamydomonas eustigma]|eukprot:GAX74905.1 hypothetical protein CEUSTIGMA_g2351.t1 [Chlamydomonas eustigma]